MIITRIAIKIMMIIFVAFFGLAATAERDIRNKWFYGIMMILSACMALMAEVL